MTKLRTLLLLGIAAMVLVGCSGTRNIESIGARPSDSLPILGELDEREGLLGGSQASAELEKIFDSILASNDPCAILTQQTIQDIAFDPTVFASADARETLAVGLIDVYDHLSEITDESLDPALAVQRSTFVKVLETVDQYALSPNGSAANAEITALVESDEFLDSQNQIAIWMQSACG